MAGLKLKNASKSFGKIEVLRNINLDIEQGEFIVFVGPSGCGKSTLLRMIAGLETVTGGTIEIDGSVVNNVPPSKRGIAMVFQSYALYPHMSVYDNMAFGMKIAKAPRKEIDRQVRKTAETLKLTDYLGRLPKALSGGQRQRVAIGRAIVRDPKIFLFDEPLSNLDAALRVATRIEISRLKDAMPDATMIYVTHDQVEAMTLADRIVVLSDGTVEQVGAPIDIYENPANRFVAKFIGSPAMNILPATVMAAGIVSIIEIERQHRVELALGVDPSLVGQKVQLGLRPEDLSAANNGNALFDGTVSHVEMLGEVTLVYLGVEGTDELVTVKLHGIHAIEVGTQFAVAADPAKLHLFDQSGLNLRTRAFSGKV